MPRLIFQGFKVRLAVTAFEPLGKPTGPVSRLTPHVQVQANCEATGALCDLQRAAFDHFVARPRKYERRLLRYLRDASCRNLERLAGDHDPAALERFAQRHGLRDLRGLESQAYWRGLTLFDVGWAEHGLLTFDFDVAWDPEHGLSLATHQGAIVAEAGLADFTNRGTSLLPHVRIVQKHSPEVDVRVPAGRGGRG